MEEVNKEMDRLSNRIDVGRIAVTEKKIGQSILWRKTCINRYKFTYL